jgi:hypothetical protein
MDTQRREGRGREKREDVAYLQTCRDQSGRQHYCADAITVRNAGSYCADCRQTNRRKKNQKLEAEGEQGAHRESDAENCKHHGTLPYLLILYRCRD